MRFYAERELWILSAIYNTKPRLLHRTRRVNIVLRQTFKKISTYPLSKWRVLLYFIVFYYLSGSGAWLFSLSFHISPAAFFFLHLTF